MLKMVRICGIIRKLFHAVILLSCYIITILIHDIFRNLARNNVTFPNEVWPSSALTYLYVLSIKKCMNRILFFLTKF